MNLKKLLSIRFIIINVLSILLIACQSQPITYQLDPEFTSIIGQNQSSKIIAVKVIDNRSALPTDKTNEHLNIVGPEDIAANLQKKISTQIKQSGHKIINKPLLADLSIEIKINRLDIKSLPGTFKSTLIAKSQFQLTIRKQGQQWSKIFKGSKSQDVANPTESLDATGVINQLLSQQLKLAFADKSLKELLSTSPY